MQLFIHHRLLYRKEYYDNCYNRFPKARKSWAVDTCRCRSEQKYWEQTRSPTPVPYLVRLLL